MTAIALTGITVVEPLSGADGVCFSATVTLDGRRVGLAMGDGRGRPTLHVADTTARAAIERECAAIYLDAHDSVTRWIEDTIDDHRAHPNDDAEESL